MEWKVGYRFTLEYLITKVVDDYVIAEIGDAENILSAEEMALAKLIHPAAPEPRIPEIKVGQQWVTRGGETVTIISDDGTCTYPFRYKTRFGGTRLVTRGGWHSSPERPDEDDLMQIVEAPEPQKLDLTEPIRLKGGAECLYYIGKDRDGYIHFQWNDGACGRVAECELENIPEPKITGRREAVLLDNGSVIWAGYCGDNCDLAIVGRKWVEIEAGDGMGGES